MTPTPLASAFCKNAGQVRLAGDNIEGACEPLVESGVLTEVVSYEDDINAVCVYCVIQALDQATGVAGNSRIADFSLPLGLLGEFVPLGVFQPTHVVDGVVEVDIHIVRPQTAEAPLQRTHHGFLALGRAGNDLRSEVDLVTPAANRVSNGSLRIPSAVALSRVKVVDAPVECMLDDFFFSRVQTATPEGNVRHLNLGAPERDIPAHLSLGFSRRWNCTAQGE